MLNVKNSLHVLTPYALKEFTSVYIHSVEQRNYYIIGMEFAGLNNDNWLQVSQYKSFKKMIKQKIINNESVYWEIIVCYKLLVGLYATLKLFYVMKYESLVYFYHQF